MDRSKSSDSIRRTGKEIWERGLAALLLLPLLPVFAICAAAIKIEGLLDPRARGPVFFAEKRVSRGRVFDLLKFRTLPAAALESLGPGPTHIATIERTGRLTRVGRVIKQWYLDELPQLWNIVRGDMFLIGTRPWPLELYEQEIARGVTRKRDMPAGLVGPVQSHKGDSGTDPLQLDLEYWEAYRTYPTWRLLLLDLRILARSLRVQLQHKGL
ncbi:MAG: sugar transferase [Actinomycetota bacterium]|nr:sugar transferase [Actinomycetota bacterium]